jgi:cysteine peptidase B
MGLAERLAAQLEPPVADSKAEVLAMPPSVDWRKHGAVTQVKDQGQCGACWAFSTTGNIEGQWKIKGHGLRSLSEQILISCNTRTTYGCGGGFPYLADQWLITERGGQIPTEASYPFTGGDPNCSYAGNVIGATIKAVKRLPSNEAQMAAWVSTGGPISVIVDASTWQGYAGGVLIDCPQGHGDHAVLIVGYDNGDGTHPYWIVKNSWGTAWGEGGYIRVLKGKDLCSISASPVTAVVAGGVAPPPPPSPPGPPTPPSHHDTFVESGCGKLNCNSCKPHSYPTGKCHHPAGSGASIKYECGPGYLSKNTYDRSMACGGGYTQDNLPFNTCLVKPNGERYTVACP